MNGLGRVGLDLVGLEFYDLNLIRLAIKNFFVTQPNPPSPKNRPNLTSWVGLD